MLNSVKTITDLIVVNDTGSTDGTQELIKKFGLENNIPIIFERPDDFEKSRNFAMQKLRDVVKDLEWDSNKTHGYWIDVMRI
jgi:glycosyltransferase involved in cell wall biosynthesis